MPHSLLYALLAWHAILAGALAVYAFRAPSTLLRTVALAALGPIVIAALSYLAALRSQPGYLDIALVIAMLGMAETLTILRTVERRGAVR